MTTVVRRRTKQQAAVAEFMADQDVFLSAQDVHAAMRGTGSGIGLATVYRLLQRMVQDGELDAVTGPDAETKYRRCSSAHHHHLVCTHCGATAEFEDALIEKAIAGVAKQFGYSDTTHTFEVRGLCPECRNGSRGD